jgi:hypothetical protein
MAEGAKLNIVGHFRSKFVIQFVKKMHNGIFVFKSERPPEVENDVVKPVNQTESLVEAMEAARISFHPTQPIPVSIARGAAKITEGVVPSRILPSAVSQKNSFGYHRGHHHEIMERVERVLGKIPSTPLKDPVPVTYQVAALRPYRPMEPTIPPETPEGTATLEAVRNHFSGPYSDLYRRCWESLLTQDIFSTLKTYQNVDKFLPSENAMLFGANFKRIADLKIQVLMLEHYLRIHGKSLKVETAKYFDDFKKIFSLIPEEKPAVSTPTVPASIFEEHFLVMFLESFQLFCVSVALHLIPHYGFIMFCLWIFVSIRRVYGIYKIILFIEKHFFDSKEKINK